MAAATVICVVVLPHSLRRGFLAVTLAVVAAIYVGFALVDRRPSSVALEITWAGVTVGTALLGLWISPIWLAAGYFGHVVWDIVHRAPLKLIGTRGVPLWYAPACLVYDVPIGLAALLLS